MPKDESKRKRVVVEEVDSMEPEMSPETPEISETDIDTNKYDSAEKAETHTIDKESETVTETETDTTTEESTVVVEPPEEKLDEEVITDEDSNDDVNSEFVPEIQSPGGPNPLVIIIPGIFLLGALMGGIYFYQKSLNPVSIPTPTPDSQTLMASPTPTPVASTAPVDLTKYTINILNGSGIAGEAGRAKSLLTTAGFKVGTTGNASTYDFTKTVIKVKSEVPSDFTTQLTTALSKNYTVDTVQTLPASSSDIVQIIIGSSKASN